MGLSGPQWLIDGAEVGTFVFGRTAQMAVDVSDFAGGELTFKLWKATQAPPLAVVSVQVPAVGPAPVTVTADVTLDHQWKVLFDLPTTYSYVSECVERQATLPYRSTASFLADPISDDLLFPPLHFTVTAPGQTTVTSGVIRRESPAFIPGNRAELLVDGNEILPRVIADINAAQHHVHLNWFFFDAGALIAEALEQAANRGVEVRLLFDAPATAMPEPLGQGIPLDRFDAGLDQLRAAGVRVQSSSMLVAPLDNLRTITDPEYRDRIDVQKDYVARLMLTHGGILAWNAFQNRSATRSLPVTIQRIYQSAGALGSAGIGSPALLGGCRDHTKLIIVDGRIAHCGGANGQRYYLYDNPIDPARDATEESEDPATTEKWPKWHDCFIRYEGPAVVAAQRYFVERWAVSSGEYLDRASAAYFPPPVSVGSASIKVISNVPGLERDIGAEYLRMFRNATQRIRIENPYVTDDLIAHYLVHAAQVRNVPVELFVPHKYLDFAIARDLMGYRQPALVAAGIQLYAYNSHMLHVKVATADGHLTIVSSYNFAKSSAAQLFEHGVVVDDAAFAAQVEQRLFDVDRPVSVRVTDPPEPDWAEVGRGPMRLLDRVV